VLTFTLEVLRIVLLGLAPCGSRHNDMWLLDQAPFAL
jgi:hypothetical protein